MRSIAIVWDGAATADAAAAETGAAEAAAVASIGGVIDEVASIAEARIGCAVARVPLASEPRTMLAQLAAVEADVVVNLAESWAGSARNETGIAWLLELSGRPYTGAPPRALGLCLEKPLTRALLSAAGVPVPDGFVLCTPDDALAGAALGDARWILKPAAQDASHGIDATSVVRGEPALRARAAALFARGLGPALAERYVEGRELNVSIVELDGARARALPIAEIVYDDAVFPGGAPKILTFAAKWDEASAEYRGSRSVEARDLSPAQRTEIERVALAAWRALGLRDYGRVDLRLEPDGRPFVIDVNPNPDLSRGAGLCLAAERGGVGYDALVEGIIRGAARRARAS